MTERKYDFELGLTVRDYECDFQGIVNNAVYLNYLEHTRHAFLKSAGLDIMDLHHRGIDPVVSRIEVDYRAPLTAGDSFVSRLRFEREGVIRLVFYQDLYRASDGKPVVGAKVTAVCRRDGEICMKVPSEVERALESFPGSR